MIDNTDKEIKLKANTKKITIEIPTEMIIKMFYEQYGDNEYKIKNKKIFRENFAESIRDVLEEGILDDIAEQMLDDECVKYIESEE